MTARLEARGLPPGDTARLRADRRVAAALAMLPPHFSPARLVFTDDNGPKGGPAIRCALTVGVPRRGRLHVEARATTWRLALDGAVSRLQRRLERTREIARDSRRRPKKYYAAARAVQA
jgi:hypothetical protein